MKFVILGNIYKGHDFLSNRFYNNKICKLCTSKFYAEKCINMLQNKKNMKNNKAGIANDHFSIIMFNI